MSTSWRDDVAARPSGRDMRLPQLWLLGVTHPARAFDALRVKPAPRWGFWVVVAFNLIISRTTLLALYLLGRGPRYPRR